MKRFRLHIGMCACEHIFGMLKNEVYEVDVFISEITYKSEKKKNRKMDFPRDINI